MYPELSSGDPPTPEDFPGTDEGSHYISSPSDYERMVGRLIRPGVSPEDTKRVMDKAGITIEETRTLRDRIFEVYPQLKETAKNANFWQQRQDELNRSLSQVGVHALKTWPVYFETVVDGRKTFEIRKNDRDFHVGDTLVLQEWDPEKKSYTGRRVEVEVTYLTSVDDFGHLKPGVVVMGIKK